MTKKSSAQIAQRKRPGGGAGIAGSEAAGAGIALSDGEAGAAKIGRTGADADRDRAALDRLAHRGIPDRALARAQGESQAPPLARAERHAAETPEREERMGDPRQGDRKHVDMGKRG